MKPHSICVFCSSSKTLNNIYIQEAQTLGEYIGTKQHTLVYGGTNSGLMQVVADACKKQGGKSIGVIPEVIYKRQVGCTTDTELIVTANMRERKYEMRNRSEAFIALPGGFGTLEEILEVIVLKQLGKHNKPIVFVNTNNFYSGLLAQFETSFQEQFAHNNYKGLYYVASDASDTMQYIDAYSEHTVQTKY